MESKDISSFEKAVSNNNKRAEKAGAVGLLTLEQLETAYLYFGGKCAYSGLPIDTKLSIEHIIPIMSGGHSLAFNCVPVINKYNTSKSAYHLLDWWKAQPLDMNNTLYNPYRLLKVINYMVKSLESINTEDETIHVLTDNEIDTFLSQNKELMEKNFPMQSEKMSYKNISQIELLRKMDILRSEDINSMYEELDNMKINTAIFFEEALHELRGEVPDEILILVEERISHIPNITIDDKKIFKKEMNPEDIKIRKELLEWAEDEKIENKYGIAGYMDFEVLKKQTNIKEFLTARKLQILEMVGANEEDFNNVINKVPNILTNMKLQERIEDIKSCLKVNTKKIDNKSSEMYRYLINKPDLVLSGENMDILLKYSEKIPIDKRLLKKGIPITTILDNLEMSIELLAKADLGIDEKISNRILNKIINNTNGSLLRDAYKNLKKIVKNEDNSLDKELIERDAARWLICISEKYNALELFKSNRINRTRSLYKNMKFNEEGYLVGVNPNAYIVPKIIRLANLKITREAESDLINNIFFVKRVQQGQRVDKILRDLAERVRKKNPEYSNEDIIQEASRWFVFLSEMSQVSLEVMFDDNVKQKYINATESHYKNMQFDQKGNFIDYKIDELKEMAIGIDYMTIVDRYFHTKGDCYIIGDKLIPKDKIQGILYEELSKCKTKKSVKNVCMATIKRLEFEIKRQNKEEPGREDR